MAPPKFDDLGKAGSDLFKKGFEHGNLKLEIKNSANNIDFTVKGCNSLAANTINSSVEANIKKAIGDFDVKKTFHTNGKIDLEVSNSKLIPNAGKTTVTGVLRGVPRYTSNENSIPESGIPDYNSHTWKMTYDLKFTYDRYKRWRSKTTNKKKRMKISTTELSFSCKDGGFVPGKFKQAFTNSKLNVNFASTMTSKPVLNLDAVFAVKDFNAGAALGFDVGSSALRF